MSWRKLFVPSIPINRNNGFLLSIVQMMGSVWEGCAIWSWAGVFHRRIKSDQEGRVQIVQNNILHDLCFLTQLILAILFATVLIPDLDVKSSRLALLILAICIWNCIDLLVDSVHLPIFGLKNRPTEPELMTLARAQRRMLLVLIYYTQLIFSYAVIYWMLQEKFGFTFDKPLENLGHAIQMSFSTMTTVGYGTYAPVELLPILVSMCQTATGILMVAGSIAQMASMLKVNNGNHENHESRSGDCTHEVVHEEARDSSEYAWKLGLVLPPLVTAGAIAFIYCMISFFE